MEIQTKKVFRGWEDMKILNLLDHCCSIGNFDESDGDEATMMWGNEKMLSLFGGISLAEFQKVHNFRGNSTAQNKLNREINHKVQALDMPYSFTKTFKDINFSVRVHPVDVIFPESQKPKRLALSMMIDQNDKSAVGAFAAGYSNEMIRHMNVISILFGTPDSAENALLVRPKFSSPRAEEFYCWESNPEPKMTLADLINSCIFEDVNARKEIEASIKALTVKDKPIEFICAKRAETESGQLWHRVVCIPALDPGTLEPCVIVNEFDISSLMQTKLDITSMSTAQHSLRNFIDVIGHELLTPLNGIRGLCQAMQGNDGLREISDVMGFIEVIHGRAKHLTGLVQDMIQHAASAEQNLPLCQEETDLYPMVEEVLAEQRAVMEPGGSVVLHNRVQSPFLINCDVGKLRQVLQGLIENAVKFTTKGQVGVSAELHDKYALVEVEDTGSGISPEEQHEIWMPYTQLDMTASRRTGGLGIGLALVKELVKAHGGIVGVRSQGKGSGLGSTFYFTLPIALPPTAKAAQLPRARLLSCSTISESFRMVKNELHPVAKPRKTDIGCQTEDLEGEASSGSAEAAGEGAGCRECARLADGIAECESEIARLGDIVQEGRREQERLEEALAREEGELVRMQEALREAVREGEQLEQAVREGEREVEVLSEELREAGLRSPLSARAASPGRRAGVYAGMESPQHYRSSGWQ